MSVSLRGGSAARPNRHEMKLFLPLATCYLGLVILANWLASAYVVGVPLTEYQAPAGVFCIGAVLVLRDWIQQL
ncbi:MAG: hypothetical protein ABSC36_00970, partial [Gaiellaceae bacterium]